MKKITLVLVLLLCIPSISSAQDGSLDTSFGDNGIVFRNFEDANNGFRGLIEVANDKIMVIVNVENIGGLQTDLLLRYLEDGTLDESFADSGVFQPSGERVIRSFGALSNDNFILSYAEGDQHFLVKYFSDTSIDVNFGDEGTLLPLTTNQTFRSFRINEDDSILVYGQEIIDGIVHLIIKRFLANGEPDLSFGNNGFLKYAIAESNLVSYFTFTIGANNKVLITYKETENNTSQLYIARFMENGAVDSSFGNNGIATIPIEEEFNCGCSEFNNQTLLVGCSYYDNVNEFTFVKKTLKLDSNGIFDQSFGNGGYIDGVMPVFLQPNQKFIGDTSYENFEGGSMINYKRYESNGSLQVGFSVVYEETDVNTPRFYSLKSGKFLVASHQIWYEANPFTNIILLRYNNDPLAIEENTLQNFSIYPNPSNGIFNLKSESFTEDISYQITDISGKLIQKGVLVEADSQIDISNTESGIYFLQAGGASFKLVKQ